MNKLKNATCYLCGAMDRVDDGGVEWRREISPKLKDMDLDIYTCTPAPGWQDLDPPTPLGSPGV